MVKSKNNHKREPLKIVQHIRQELAPASEWYKSRSFGDVIFPEDDILRKNRYNLKVYRSLLTDEQIKACFIGQRVAGAIAADWEVVPASDAPKDKEIAEFVSKNIEALMFDDKCRKMLHANWYGFQIAEIMWGLDSGKRLVIDDIRVRKPERFLFGVDGTLYLRQGLSDKKPLPDKKFWVLKASSDNDDDIYGPGLAHVCYWPVYLKRNGLKFWSVLVEKFAMPTAVGKYVPGTPQEDIKELLNMLDSIAGETSIAVPEGTVVDLLESIKSSSGEHEKFCKYLDQILAKAILGQDGTSENGRYAGTAEVQENVKDLIVKADADLLCESFNEVIKWLVEYNWLGATPPKLVKKFDKPENLKEMAEQDKLICDMGYRPTLKYVTEKYGGEWIEAQNPTNDPSFAEQEANILELADNDVVEDWEEILAPMVKPIENILAESSSFEEFEQELIKAYPRIDATKLQELISNATFAMRVAGKLGVENV